MAKIETIRDLIHSQIQEPRANLATATPPSYMNRLRNSTNRNAAAEFLGRKPEDRLKSTPVSLRKRIEEKTSFVNPDKQFSTPTLLRKMSRNPEATVDVAEAHTIMSKAEVEAQAMQDHAKAGIQNPQQLVKASRKHSFSRTPRTIANLIK